MKTNNSMYKLTQLEHLFAEDFGSPVFPILANYYFNLSKLTKALTVCQVGLKHSPNNLEGQYILSKIYIMNNKLFKAEQLLKHIVCLNQCNMEALTALIKIEIFLKRHPKTINKYLVLAFKIIPNNQKISNLYNQLCKNQSPTKHNNKTKTANLITNEKSTKFTKQLATKTMYNILINQKKYTEALQILEFMIKTKNNITFAKKEQKKN